MCGGTRTTQVRAHFATGLSPRVRGNRVAAQGTYPGGRSIPACAGEPGTGSVGAVCVKVYPRVCGGTTCPCPSYIMARRSIPACAGEPVHHLVQLVTGTVYPRVCGGTAFADVRHPAGNGHGLSPRVRGNLSRELTNLDNARSIPACAGEPIGDSMYRVGVAVYPRVCGGTIQQNYHINIQQGLSPLCAGEPR